jgi:hypothetical protein
MRTIWFIIAAVDVLLHMVKESWDDLFANITFLHLPMHDAKPNAINF